MGKPAISVENLSKQYDLGVIGTGTLSRDLNRWWARVRKQPDPYSRIGQKDAFERIGESILALDDVSFQVKQGEALGIIGRNGAGKSTLLKILSRVTAPTSGVVKVKGRIGSLLEVGTGFHPELTGRENVYLNGAILGMRKEEVSRKFDEIVDFAGVQKFIDTPVKRYSSGMYVRLAFAVAAHLDPEILIVDEVLAVGDAEFQKKCLGKMGDVAGEGRTVLFVSHNMRAIQELCKRCILFIDGNVYLDSATEPVVEIYLSSTRPQRSLTSGKPVIYEDITFADADDPMIHKIELLDQNDIPMHHIRTWDKIKFIVHYYSNIRINDCAIELQLSDMYGNILLRFSTKPDSNIKFDLNEGLGFATCEVDQFPLPAGNYWLGAGLSIPEKRWLFFNQNLTEISVGAKDVFHSGLAPDKSRAAIVTPHRWIIENKQSISH